MELIDLFAALGTALVGGFVGAAGGAWGAQRIAEKEVSRKELMAELRNTNAAIQLAFSVCNVALAYRSQFSKGLAENLQEKRLDIEICRKIRLHEGDQLYIELDLRKFPIPTVPVDALKEILFSKVSVVGRELAALNEIESARNTLREADRVRNEFVDKRSNGEHASVKDVFSYLGLKRSDGVTDETYYTAVASIDSCAKDLIFFGHLLCEDLTRHGEALRKKLVKWNSGKDSGIQRVSAADFSGPQAAGLMPTAEEYAIWTHAFKMKAELLT